MKDKQKLIFAIAGISLTLAVVSTWVGAQQCSLRQAVFNKEPNLTKNQNGYILKIK